MKLGPRVAFNVTQAHIDKATRKCYYKDGRHRPIGYNYNCPIALALIELGFKKVSVDADGAFAKVAQLILGPSARVEKFMATFDYEPIAHKKVKPITLHYRRVEIHAGI